MSLSVNDLTHIIRSSREVLGLDEFGRKKVDPYANRKYLYIFKTPHDTYNAVNYDACNAYLNSFMTLFDVFGSLNHAGKHELSDNGNTSEVWFEVSKEFVEIIETPVMKNAIKKLGVEVVYEYPFGKE